MSRVFAIVIPLPALLVMALYYGVLPGGEKINWWIGPIRSRGMDAFAVATAAGFFVLLVAGIFRSA